MCTYVWIHTHTHTHICTHAHTHSHMHTELVFSDFLSKIFRRILSYHWTIKCLQISGTLEEKHVSFAGDYSSVLHFLLCTSIHQEDVQ